MKIEHPQITKKRNENLIQRECCSSHSFIHSLFTLQTKKNKNENRIHQVEIINNNNLNVLLLSKLKKEMDHSMEIKVSKMVNAFALYLVLLMELDERIYFGQIVLNT